MYRDYTDYAVVSRIASGKEILGFLLVEFTGEYNELFPVFFGLVANRIASLWKTGFGNKPETYYFENQGNTIFEILLESSLEFQKQYEKKKIGIFFLLMGIVEPEKRVLRDFCIAIKVRRETLFF